MIFYITEQHTRVSDHTYEIEAPDIDEAERRFQALPAKDKHPIHIEDLTPKCEVTAIQEV